MLHFGYAALRLGDFWVGECNSQCVFLLVVQARAEQEARAREHAQQAQLLQARLESGALSASQVFALPSL